jgi:hypothetical protein
MSITLTQATRAPTAFLSETRGSNMGSREEAVQVSWEPYREVIQTLYLTRDMSLNEVMTYMRDTYNFARCEGSVNMGTVTHQ